MKTFDADAAVNMGQTQTSRDEYEAAFVLSLTLARVVFDAVGTLDERALQGALSYVIHPTIAPLDRAAQ